jgi:hypothetical protein
LRQRRDRLPAQAGLVQAGRRDVALVAAHAGRVSS